LPPWQELRGVSEARVSRVGLISSIIVLIAIRECVVECFAASRRFHNGTIAFRDSPAARSLQ
jgi:hypothetical protein